ncbi:MAG: DUF349 domain-containing protein [Bacteroidetes bacterium]|nr:MAG: DUF349 domain-containing protein [Bacteroidota bacterium]
MSEKDNLLKADGKKDAKTPKKEDLNVDVETVIEDAKQNIAEVQEKTASNIAEDSITEADNAEEIERKPEEVVEEITTEAETVKENNTENLSENKSETETKVEDEALTEIEVEDAKETEDKAVETETATEDNTENLSENKKEDQPEKGDEALTEIETENAKEAEDEEKKKHPIIEEKDYHTMSMNDLVDELEVLVENEKIQAIKSQVDTIKSEFSAKFGALLAEKKAEFIAEGGNTIDFYFDSPLKKRYNSIFKTYRDKRQAHYKNLEKSLKENLENRLEIIAEIKGLINVEENINTTYKHFKALQERWRNAGPIPRDKYNNVWNNYHHHVEIFYDFLHLNRDLRDLDFKHNLEQKIKLIDRAEELAQYDDCNSAFRELQVLHKIWKEELGPVDKEQREQIWERFSAATKAIHEKRQVYFGELDKAYEKNLETKHDIIAQINAVTKDDTSNHSIWQKRIKNIEDLRNQFFNAGKVPIKVNEATWSKFKTSVREFNQKKNAFYKGLKKDQYENLQKKLALIKIADENKDNTDFETTTPLMKKIQSDWKSIGHVPRKDSDKIWKQFKAACNHYFNKFHDVQNESNKEEIEALDKKNALLEKLKTIEVTADVKTNLALIKDYIAEWKTLGRVPYNRRFIDGKFNKTIDGLYNKLDISKADTELLKYDNKLESLANANDKRLLDNEHNFLRKKIDDIKGEINQLENNLQFFSNVDDTNPLVKDVYKNIEKHKTALHSWKSKLKRIKRFY